MLDPEQTEVLREMAVQNIQNLFLWGSAGTGKTILLVEVLKMKVARLKREGKKFKIFVTTWTKDNTSLLREKLKGKYLARLPEMQQATVTSVEELRNELGISSEIDDLDICSSINELFVALSDKYSGYEVLIMCDECPPGEGDWSKTVSPTNVHYLVALQPLGDSLYHSDDSIPSLEIITPRSSVFLKQLLRKHRNCHEIREFYQFFISHTEGMGGYLSQAKDIAVSSAQLPPGHAPVWLEFPEEASEVKQLSTVSRLKVIQNYKDVMVMHDITQDGETLAETASFCNEKGWKFESCRKIFGTEFEAVVLLNVFLEPERITRGINLLVITTNKSDDTLISAAEHSIEVCGEESCVHTGQQLLVKLDVETMQEVHAEDIELTGIESITAEIETEVRNEKYLDMWGDLKYNNPISRQRGRLVALEAYLTRTGKTEDFTQRITECRACLDMTETRVTLLVTTTKQYFCDQYNSFHGFV